MIEFVTEQKHSNLILFVHGFTGGQETWKNQEGEYFHDYLLNDDVLKENFDVATFEYYSKLINLFSKAAPIKNKIFSLFKRAAPKSRKNIGVNEISNYLSSEIRFKLSEYDNIVIIAHSMGGLVVKSCIVNEYESKNNSKIKLFLSLAVPHNGADLATYGKLLTNNEQVKDLAPLSELISQLSNKWVKMSVKPSIKYYYGMHDGIVKIDSAKGTDDVEQDCITCDDDHLSICKPEGENELSVAATLTFIKEFLSGKTEDIDLEIKELDGDEQFSDEVFVVKLLLADVHSAAVKNSKEHFLNAEYARKLFSSAADQKKLEQLYKKIRSLYLDSYDKYVNKQSFSSSELVNNVHEKIVENNSDFLKTALPLIHGLHKKGMLHQLANDLNRDVWWSDNHSVEALDELKKTIVEANKL